uniref:Uncharacterized protein n=1 Tax=Ciona intestinalis TaxID=7719 RepID=F6UJC7_CIOIN
YWAAESNQQTNHCFTVNKCNSKTQCVCILCTYVYNQSSYHLLSMPLKAHSVLFCT